MVPQKGFMKALKAFIKLFKAPQRIVNIKISVSFYFNTTFGNARGGKGEELIDPEENLSRFICVSNTLKFRI